MNGRTIEHGAGRRGAAWCAGVILALALAQAAVWQTGEPFYNNDETRHLMTGVFFRDLLVDLPLDHLRAYAVESYLQYPALGLMVWPPLFHGLEGLLFLLTGPSLLAAKILVGLFAALACRALFRLVQRTHGIWEATAATLLFGLAPLVFQLSHHVMLEIPALALALVAIDHFVLYLDAERGRRRDLWIAAAAAAGFALTRFDAPVLLVFFLLALLLQRRFDLLRRREVWLAAALALAVVLPVLLPMLVEFGRTHLQVTVQGTGADAGLWDALVFYPRHLPRQAGWALVLPALIGLASAALRPERRRACWPYLALAAATYLTFTPLAEREPRHAIYWIPAFAALAAEGLRQIAGWLGGLIDRRTGNPVGSPNSRPAGPRIEQPLGREAWPRAQTALAGFAALAALAIIAALWQALATPVRYVRGYEEAARYVIAHTHASRFTLVDGFLNGNFIYQVRRHDPGRQLWVLRGDKLLYGVRNDPSRGYREHAGSEQQILDTLFRHDPELIVVEQPQVLFDIPAAERLRQTLAAHPERFELVKTVPLTTNAPIFQGVRLDIYRSRIRNPAPARRLSLDMLGLGRALEADLPPD